MALISVGQATQQSLRVQIAYEKAGQYLEQAVITIEATNTVGASTTVEYRAGRSVTMLPGFEARVGSTFTADIKPVDIGKEDATLRLTTFPNPFDQSTMIDYYLPAAGNVAVWILDAQGKLIQKLVDEKSQAAGHHRVEWRPEGASPGVYIPIIEANQQKAAGRVLKK